MISSPALGVSLLSYLVMLAAYRLHRLRGWHAGIMTTCMIYDICLPFYLFFARNWPHRLIEQGGIFNFLVWMHVGLDILLFTLYALQVREGLALWRRDERARWAHAQQARVILAVRALVILSGGLLAP